MLQTLFLMLALLATTGNAAPCFQMTAVDQDPFATIPDRSGFMLRGDTVHDANELTEKMQRAIDRDMSIEYHQARYMSALKERACLYRCEEFPVAVKIIDCVVDVIEAPHIEVIPTRRLSHDIHCTTPTCTIGYEDRTTVSTTHSVNAGFGAAMSSAPFGMGVEFTKSVGYGFSKTNEESTAFSYEFNIEHGDSGYIGVASAQISAKIRRQGRVGKNHIDQTGYHEAVVMEADKPRSIVAFIYH